ncbi:MAG: TIGR04282 family arsenosugar biosynthesis glycosyltransferase [Candidatus Latescibacterota bacterium]|nr:TIGR04282 family arsenosugar biosynthesis glycosyltransferase [Candidatus Latescibacterota bacterium]
MTSQAVLFVKNPTPGRVKTRLQFHLGAEGACRLYSAFVGDCASLLASCRADCKVVAYAPADAEPHLRDLLQSVQGLTFEPQAEGDLGQRMAAAFTRGFLIGAQRIVLVGSDSPSLPVELVDRALYELEDHDVVIGPSLDGGYYLIGLRRMLPEIFAEIEWSTGQVLAQTLAALPEGAQLSVLPPWYDVDEPEAAAFLRQHLQALARSGMPVAPLSAEALSDLKLPSPS